MKLYVKEQIKMLLAQRGMTLKELAEKLSKETKEKYTGNSLTQRMGRGNITYNEMLLISEILSFKIQFIDLTD